MKVKFLYFGLLFFMIGFIGTILSYWANELELLIFSLTICFFGGVEIALNKQPQKQVGAKQ